MNGRHCSMPIGEFEAIVSRNINGCWNGARLFYFNEGWRRRVDVPPNVASLVVGPPAEGNWMNVPVPEIPEHTQSFGMLREMPEGEPEMRQYRHTGWRFLLHSLLTNRTIKAGPDVIEWLGRQSVDQIRRNMGRQKDGYSID